MATILWKNSEIYIRGAVFNLRQTPTSVIKTLRHNNREVSRRWHQCTLGPTNSTTGSHESPLFGNGLAQRPSSIHSRQIHNATKLVRIRSGDECLGPRVHMWRIKIRRQHYSNSDIPNGTFSELRKT
ncbi:Uncharacterised protein at_DN1748 [Pycnogonum litorale]